MNANINNILLASILFIVYFSVASSFVYPTTKEAVVPTQTITQLFMLTEGISEPITFTVPINVLEEITEIVHHKKPLPTSLDEITEVDVIENIPLSTPLDEITEVEVVSNILKPTQFQEITEVEPVENIPLPTYVQEITIDVQPIDNIPTSVQDEVTENVQNINSHDQTEAIINKLNKRQSLKIFAPLNIKRKVDKVEKNLATTKAEILTLYKENSIEVTAILKTHLPELFT